MVINFATCEVDRAFEYIQKVYPSRVVNKEEISKLLDLVGKDILRVQDPSMYGNQIQVIRGNNFTEADNEAIQDAIKQLKENDFI